LHASHALPDVIVLGPASGSRLNSFSAACAEKFGRPPRVISWSAFLENPDVLHRALSANAYLKFESPDRDFASLAALYAAGEAQASAQGVEVLSVRDVETLRQGAIGSPMQLWFGLRAAMDSAKEIAKSKDATISITPDLAALTFDKTACLAHLSVAGIPTPRALGPAHSLDSLAASMQAAGTSRVFVKVRHGAAAAGMLALARNGGEWLVWTTAAIGEDGAPYAAKSVRRLTDWREINCLIERLSRLSLHVEQWIPKFGLAQESIDLRIVVADSRMVPVVRGSRYPMTNLHIGGSRHAPDDLIARIGDDAWHRLLDTTRRAAATLPEAHSLGLDVALRSCGTKSVVLEVNAFGDYIKDMAEDPHRLVADAIARRMQARELTGELA
jgi:hypothetical protein